MQQPATQPGSKGLPGGLIASRSTGHGGHLFVQGVLQDRKKQRIREVQILKSCVVVWLLTGVQLGVCTAAPG